MPVLRSATAGSGEAPKQFTQPSRKGKKAWRKNVDVTEVEEGLRELNNEIIRGGVIREKASEDIFTIDTAGDSKIPQKFPKHVKKGLKADEIINKRSAVPAVSMRKRPGDKTTDGLVSAKRQKTDWVSHKDLARLKKVADGHHEDTIAVKDASFDLWDAPAEQPAAVKAPTDFLPEKTEPKVPKTMKQQPLSLLANGKQIPAVPKPTGGYSYNPSFPEYESRLAEESAKAIEAEQKRLAAEAAEAAKLEAAARSAAEAEAAEQRANMSEWEEDSEWEGFQSGVEDERPSAKQPKRKTQAQRNRIKRRKEEEQLARHKAEMKARRAQEQRIKEIAAEVAEKEKQKALMLAQQAAEQQEEDDDGEIKEEKLRRRQLGKYKLPEKDLELVLPDELQESLRLLKPEGNLLKDRYRSMLLRGKVEIRRHIPFKKQAKTKVTEKWTHKDFVL
ncbi:P60-like protein [Trichoderma citrinoviride]|uniref:Ribosome biogenesis protein NOP53 n=1 Tax=Trichoderma citrinoviride TaxID=58853 RepID=A0A2T4BNU2_9HYPO|nr:P60-like protein [Trichoderma citrinoviride]PTB70988.1 P60-like protein [Trichoderma citrinoviride]